MLAVSALKEYTVTTVIYTYALYLYLLSVHYGNSLGHREIVQKFTIGYYSLPLGFLVT